MKVGPRTSLQSLFTVSEYFQLLLTLLLLQEELPRKVYDIFDVFLWFKLDFSFVRKPLDSDDGESFLFMETQPASPRFREVDIPSRSMLVTYSGLLIVL